MHVNLTNIILATVAVLGVVSAVASFLYKRGRYEQALKDALDRCTSAVLEVTGELKEFKGIVVAELSDLKTRVTVLEKIQAKG